MAKLYQRPLEPDFCYDRRRECEKSCGKMICDSDAYRALKGRMQ